MESNTDNKDTESLSNNLDNNIEEPDAEEAIEGVIERVAKSDPEAAAKISTYIVQKVHHGPMPSPEDIASYAQIQKDLPERMMTMAESAQKNKAQNTQTILDLKRQEIELHKQQLNTQHTLKTKELNNQKLSLYLASVVVILCITGSFYLALQDKTAVAIVIGGTTVVGIVGAFLKSKNKDNVDTSN